LRAAEAFDGPAGFGPCVADPPDFFPLFELFVAVEVLVAYGQLVSERPGAFSQVWPVLVSDFPVRAGFVDPPEVVSDFIK
jgi:hypothetical protein